MYNKANGRNVELCCVIIPYFICSKGGGQVKGEEKKVMFIH